MRQSTIIKLRKESLPDAEFALEYEGENSAKYANRNSKKKTKMRRFYKRLIFWDYKGF